MLNKTDGDIWVAVSGGFDPLHIGHVRMIQEAREHGNKVVVILNNDNWLRGKKGFVFMPEVERIEMLKALGADEVVLTEHGVDDADRSVCKALEYWRPDVFANGGDRVDFNIPEYKLCDELGIKMVFGVGGGKIQSSSWLTNAVRTKGIRTERPWGSFTLYHHGENFWLKTLTIKPGCRTSLQRHTGRGELWMCIDGDIHAVIGKTWKELKLFDAVRFAAGVSHRVGSKHGGTIIEIGYGKCDEEDNERLADDYARVH